MVSRETLMELMLNGLYRCRNDEGFQDSDGDCSFYSGNSLLTLVIFRNP